MTRRSTAEGMAETLLGWGVPVVALRMGARGSLVATAGRDLYGPRGANECRRHNGRRRRLLRWLPGRSWQWRGCGRSGCRAAVSASFALEQFGVPVFDDQTQIEAQRRLAWARERIVANQVGAAS